MIRFLFATFLILNMSLSSFAQRLFFHSNLGYYIPVGGQTFGIFSSTSSTGIAPQTAINGSLGSGPSYKFGVGYLLTKTFGINLEAGILLPTNDKGGANTGTPYENSKVTEIYDSYESEYTSTSFYLNPSFVVRGSSGRRIVPYGKMGMFLGLYNRVNFNSTEKNNDFNYQNVNNRYMFTETVKAEYSGNLSAGVTSALGLDFLLSKNKNFGMFLEVTSRVAQWTPSKQDIETVTTVNITDENFNPISNNSTTTNESINLVKELEVGYTGPDKIGELISLNGVGFHFGIKWFILTKKGKETISQ